MKIVIKILVILYFAEGNENQTPFLIFGLVIFQLLKLGINIFMKTPKDIPNSSQSTKHLELPYIGASNPHEKSRNTHRRH